MEKAVFAGGCYWCTEAIFKRLKGVVSVASGFSSQVECVYLEFDPKVIAYVDLLSVFLKRTILPLKIDKELISAPSIDRQFFTLIARNERHPKTMSKVFRKTIMTR